MFAEPEAKAVDTLSQQLDCVLFRFPFILPSVSHVYSVLGRWIHDPELECVLVFFYLTSF